MKGLRLTIRPSIFGCALVWGIFSTPPTQAAVSAPHVQYFGYWDNGCDDPVPAVDSIRDQRGYSNVTMIICLNLDPVTGQLSDVFNRIPLAEAAGMKMIFTLATTPVTSVTRPGTFDLYWIGDYPTVWQNAITLIQPHIQNVAGFAIADEFDCAAPFGAGWTPENCTWARQRLEQIIAQVKTAFPNTPTWVNYTSAYINGIAARLPGYQVPQNADWISMDCYTPYDRCFGNASVDTLLNGLEATLNASQRVMLIPQAYAGPYLGFNLTEAEVATVAEQNYQRSQRDSRIIGIMPFIWREARNFPVIRAKYADIGNRIVGNRGTIGDYDGDWMADAAVWRPSEGIWYDAKLAPVQWGQSSDIPVPGDYNGDGRSDIAVWRPSEGSWYVRQGATAQWGAPQDIPVPGDYNGDGTTDLAVFRPNSSAWYISPNATPIVFGAAGDIPVPGDYNGDGRTDQAVFRPSNGRWYINGMGDFAWGISTDIPVPGDYDGDGRTDLAVFRSAEATWYTLNLRTGASAVIPYGLPGDIPVPADFNGDRRMDVAVFRPSDGQWYIRNQTALGPWGAYGDIPVVNSVTTVIQAMGLNKNVHFISQTVPNTMQPGQTYPVQVTLVNSGLASWQDPKSCNGTDCGYRLGSQNPADNTLWGISRVSAGTVYPGQSKTFNFNVTAPTTPGTYNFQWRMVQDSIGWLGAPTPNVTINVQAGPVNTIVLAPDLSDFNNRTYGLRDTLMLDYRAAATSFNWEFLPETALAPRSASGRIGAAAPVPTTSPSFHLATLNLSPGVYTLRVQAVNGSQQSPWAEARITLAASDFASVRIYPNPYNSRRHTVAHVTFDGLPAASTVKIFTVSGRHVKTLQPSGTSVLWDLANDSGDKVASGIYLYVISTDSGDRKTGQMTVVQ